MTNKVGKRCDCDINRVTWDEGISSEKVNEDLRTVDQYEYTLKSKEPEELINGERMQGSCCDYV